MPLTPQQEFKVGYIAEALNRGWSPEEMLSFAKKAEDALSGQTKSAVLDQILDAGKSLAGVVAGYGVPLALAAPPALGALGGYGLSRMHDVDDTDIDDIKAKELEDEYQRQTLGLARQREARDFQRLRPAKPSLMR